LAGRGKRRRVDWPSTDIGLPVPRCTGIHRARALLRFGAVRARTALRGADRFL